MSAKTAYDFSFRAIDGGKLPLSDFNGKGAAGRQCCEPMRIDAAICRPRKAVERRGDDGLVVLGVPANDFGAQEPGTEDEIRTFCETRFAVDFP